MTPRKRIAIIGLGMALKPHLESLRELGDRVEIAACYTPSAARRAAAAAQGLPIASDLDQMLKDRVLINKRLQDLLSAASLKWASAARPVGVAATTLANPGRRAASVSGHLLIWAFR